MRVHVSFSRRLYIRTGQADDRKVLPADYALADIVAGTPPWSAGDDVSSLIVLEVGCDGGQPVAIDPVTMFVHDSQIAGLTPVDEAGLPIAYSHLSGSEQPCGPTSMNYRNHRGETELRRFLPLGLSFGTTEHHDERTLLLEVYDLNRRARRTYAVKDFLDEGKPW